MMHGIMPPMYVASLEMAASYMAPGYMSGYGYGYPGEPVTLAAGQANLVLTGTSPLNGTGNALANMITGNNAANILSGLSGNDKISGLGGNDTLVGGVGKDTLTGGPGADHFDFNSISESVPGANRDVITDFGSTDKIDLSTIDANSTMSGNQAFMFISASNFSHPGQVYYDASHHILFGNTDGDAAAEFEITVNLAGITSLHSTEFIL